MHDAKPCDDDPMTPLYARHSLLKKGVNKGGRLTSRALAFSDDGLWGGSVRHIAKRKVPVGHWFKVPDSVCILFKSVEPLLAELLGDRPAVPVVA